MEKPTKIEVPNLGGNIKSTPPSSSAQAVKWICLFAIAAVVCAAVIGSIGLVTGAFSFSHNTTTTITSILTDIKGESKFVVATTTKTVVLSRSDEWRGWWGMYLGTTSVKMRVDGCKVQYYIPLTDFSASDIKVSADGRIVEVTLPPPRLDADFVDVPTDPQNYWIDKVSGWARFDKNNMVEDLKHQIRSAVIAQVANEKIDEMLEIAAKQRAVDFFVKTCTALRGDAITVRVTFRAPLATAKP